MIEIKRDKANDSRVVMSIAGISGQRKNWTVHFSYNATGEFEADLMEAAMHKALGEAVHKLRRQCYMQGYKDGRGKKSKREFFEKSHDLGWGVGGRTE